MPLNIQSDILSPLVHFFYPHICPGCGSDVIGNKHFLCLECINDLPHTGFALHANNPLEKKFRGRIPITAGMSEFYFSKSSIVQNLIHEFKYKGNVKVGFHLGKMMGKSIANSHRFSNIDLLIPLPLFTKKEFKRGFNQSEVLCKGIRDITGIPIASKNVIRTMPTETQTKKGRIERWENVEKSFSILNSSNLNGKNILLVDDVITTGATIEACGAQILKIENVSLSIASLAFAAR
jgi:ComF family protein